MSVHVRQPARTPDAVNFLGFWSAAIAAASAAVFSIAALLEMADSIPETGGRQIIYASSLVLAVAFVAMLISVHHDTDGDRRIWSFTAVSFAILYASNVSVMYVVQLFVYLPKQRRGRLSESEIVLLSDTFGSFLQAMDGLGYLFMGLSFLIATPAFASDGFERWIRLVFVANGVVTVPVFLAYFVDPGFLLLAGSWIVAVPAGTALVAIRFRRARGTATG